MRIDWRHLKLIGVHKSGASGNPRGVISDKAFITDVSTLRRNSILLRKQCPRGGLKFSFNGRLIQSKMSVTSEQKNKIWRRRSCCFDKLKRRLESGRDSGRRRRPARPSGCEVSVAKLSQFDKQALRVPASRLWSDSAAPSLHKLNPARQPPNLAGAETEPET